MKRTNANSIERCSRRRFLASASALTVASCLSSPRLSAAESPPEITKLRIMAYAAICAAPQYVADSLLRAEGFTEIEYVKADETIPGPFVGPGKADVDLDAITPVIRYLDNDLPVVVLAGIHLGCYELFGTEQIRTIRDLKGKTIPVDGLGGSHHSLLSSMVAYVGLDPRKDINWVVRSAAEGMKLFAEGKADAYLGFPPEPQELRAKKIGHVILNTATDKPWSEYFCCMLIASRELVLKYPVAAKRATRAILKAADYCVQQPERAAREMVERGFAQNYEYAREALMEVRYDIWRTYNPEDTLRFHALRLREVGLIKSTPQRLIAAGTDWRFLNQLKRELKT